MLDANATNLDCFAISNLEDNRKNILPGTLNWCMSMHACWYCWIGSAWIDACRCMHAGTSRHLLALVYIFWFLPMNAGHPNVRRFLLHSLHDCGERIRLGNATNMHSQNLITMPLHKHDVANANTNKCKDNNMCRYFEWQNNPSTQFEDSTEIAYGTSCFRLLWIIWRWL